MAFMIAEGTANGLDLEAPLRYKLEQIYMDWFVCHDPSSKSSNGAYCAEHKNRKSGNPFRIRDDLVNTNILFMQLAALYSLWEGSQFLAHSSPIFSSKLTTPANT